MDVVYSCRPGSNEELRYSLRSLVNVPHGRVWIVGGWPAWVRDVGTIPTRVLGNKYRTVTANMIAACSEPEISDPFLFFNDDMYAVEPIRWFGHHHRNTMREHITEYEQGGWRNSLYVQGLRDTLALLQYLGFEDPLCYELHVPIVVWKAPMLEACALEGSIQAYQRRSVYGALIELPSTPLADPKVYAKGIEAGRPAPTGPWLSTGDSSFPAVRPRLAVLFPEPGPHEQPARRARAA